MPKEKVTAYSRRVGFYPFLLPNPNEGADLGGGWVVTATPKTQVAPPKPQLAPPHPPPSPKK